MDTLPRRPRSSARSHTTLVVGALAALYACSFQDFGYLQDPVSAAGSGAADAGGSSSQGGAGLGGSAGATPSAGTSGKANQGGAGATSGGSSGAGAASDAGAAGAAGAEMGGSAGQAGDGGGGGLGGAAGADGSGGTAGTLGGKSLVNPSFENRLLGWSIEPAVAETNRYVYTQAPPSGSTAVDGAFTLASWHPMDEYTFELSQSLDGLEDGYYSFKGFFSSERSQGAYLFARNCGADDVEETIPTNSFVWHEAAITGIQVVGGHCEVGFSVHGLPEDWLNADSFSFSKDPPQ